MYVRVYWVTSVMSDSLGGRKEGREERREKGKNEETDMKLCMKNLEKISQRLCRMRWS